MAAVMAKGTTPFTMPPANLIYSSFAKCLTAWVQRSAALAATCCTIEGVDYLDGTEHRMLPDMIEIGSFIGLAAMTKAKSPSKMQALKTWV